MEKYQEKLKEIRDLHAKYRESTLGRKDIIKEIREKIKEIREITPVFNAELEELERYYQYKDVSINDYELVMSLLNRLLNEEDEFVLREVTTTGFYNTTGSDVNKLFGKVLFITNKDLSDQITDHLYYYDEFKELATKGINKGYPMVIVTCNLFEPSVKPKKEDVMCDEVFSVRNYGGLIGNITCYANGESFKNALDKFINYVDDNGPDFSNVDEDTLFETINNYSKSNKKKIVK